MVTSEMVLSSHSVAPILGSVCVCVCVRERESEREREMQAQRKLLRNNYQMLQLKAESYNLKLRHWIRNRIQYEVRLYNGI